MKLYYISSDVQAYAVVYAENKEQALQKLKDRFKNINTNLTFEQLFYNDIIHVELWTENDYDGVLLFY